VAPDLTTKVGVEVGGRGLGGVWLLPAMCRLMHWRQRCDLSGASPLYPPTPEHHTNHIDGAHSKLSGGGGGVVLPFGSGLPERPLRQASSSSTQQLNIWWEGPASSSAAAAAAAEAKRSSKGHDALAAPQQQSPSPAAQSRRATGSSDSIAVLAAVTASTQHLSEAGAKQLEPQPPAGSSSSEQQPSLATKQQQQQQQASEGGTQRPPVVALARPLFTSEGDEDAFCTPDTSMGGGSMGGGSVGGSSTNRSGKAAALDSVHISEEGEEDGGALALGRGAGDGRGFDGAAAVCCLPVCLPACLSAVEAIR